MTHYTTYTLRDGVRYPNGFNYPGFPPGKAVSQPVEFGSRKSWARWWGRWGEATGERVAFHPWPE